MIHQRFIRSTVFCTVAFMFFLSSALPAEEAKSERKLPKLPFPVNIDKQAGETEGLHNRIQDKVSGMWYRLVPKATYTIGSDQLEDSKEIQVRLSPYYISETCVSNAQVAQYLLKELSREPEGKEFKEMLILSKELPPARQADIHLFFRMLNLFSLEYPWGKMLGLESELDEKYSQTLDSVLHGKQFENMTEEEVVQNFKLSSDQRATFKKVMAELTKKLSEQEKNQAPYGRASNSKASEYAEFRGASLPTEAQWEVAARLAATGKLKVDNMVGHHREWCSDFYAYDYFKRKRHFDDPTGPWRSKLSKQQLNSEVPVSGLKIITRLVAMNLAVVRGETVSKRQYAIMHLSTPANSRQPKRIRLVINLK